MFDLRKTTMKGVLLSEECTWDAKRKLVYLQPSICDLAIATHGEEMHKLIILVCQSEVFNCGFGTMG